MVPMCFFCTDASTDMQYDLLDPTRDSRDIDLGSNSEIDLLKSIYAYFDAVRREIHDAAKNMSLALLVQKLFAKTIFAKKISFYPSWPL